MNKKNSERIDNFIHNLNEEQDLALLKKIISDDRFDDSMNVWNVIQVAWQINKLSNEPIIEDQLTRRIGHPFGLDRVEWWRDRAIEKYPKETEQMLEETRILIEELKKIN